LNKSTHHSDEIAVKLKVSNVEQSF